jgi:predicted permease
VNFFTSLESVAKLLVLVLPGFLAVKGRLFSEEAQVYFSKLLTVVTLPCTIFTAFVSKTGDSSILLNLGICLVICIFLLLVSAGMGSLAFIKMKDSPSKRVFITGCYLNNCGFMGIPVVQAFFPGQKDALMYTVMFMTAFNIIAYSYSVYVISGNRKFITLRHALFNPPNIALYLSLPFFLSGFKLPDFITSPVAMIGDLTTPLSMIIIGIRLGASRLGNLWKSAGVWFCSFIKLFACPLLALVVLMPLCRYLGLNRVMAVTVFAISAMPVAAMVSVFAEMYKSDTEGGANSVLLSTMLSVISIPVIMLLSPLL